MTGAGAPWRRPAVTVVVWLASLVGAAGAYVSVTGGVAERIGFDRYRYRSVLQSQLRSVEHERPGVVWLGDSTILALRAPSYPQLVQGAVPGVSWKVAGYIGADFYAYFPFVADLLTRHRPPVLVLVAHLRLFASPGVRPEPGASARNDLLSMIPTRELPRTIALPLAARGVTIPHLLLARLLRYPAVERVLYIAEGARARVADADLPWLGPNRLRAAASGMTMLVASLEASDVPITRDQPNVRMMEATVRLAHEAGVRVIVIGTPIPFETMASTVGYDHALYEQRFAILRAAVEEAGGTFVDLHAALPVPLFTDMVGHFGEPGAKVLAERIGPVVAGEVKQAMWEQWMATHAGTPPSRAGAPAAGH